MIQALDDGEKTVRQTAFQAIHSSVIVDDGRNGRNQRAGLQDSRGPS